MRPEKIIFVLFMGFIAPHKEVLCVGNETELVSVVVVFRHGERTVTNPYPNDPYKNESFWPVGFGQLTNEGKMQHFELGKYFRNRYNDFLPLKYSEKLIYVRSTDVDRTLMSAASNLAGLYPPEGNQVWDKDIPWQPIPIHTVPEQQDALLAFKKPCAKYDSLFREFMNSEMIKKLNEANKDLYDYLTINSGEVINSFEPTEFLYDTLTIEKNNNFTLPDWTKEVFPNRMESLAHFSFAAPCFTNDLARLKTGPFFYDLLKYFKDVTSRKNGSDDYIKFKIFSGHDTTVANILESLKIFEYHSPPFTSTVIFELYKNNSNGDYFVNLLYKNSSEPRNMVLNGCKFNCPLEQFDNLVSTLAVSIDDWHKECKVSLLETVTENTQNLIIASVLLVLTVSFIGILGKLIYNKSKKDRRVYLRLPDDEEQV